MTDVRLLVGDCFELLRELDDCSIDAVVTDPPYGINFMGKAWDGAAIEEAASKPRDLSHVTRLTGDLDGGERREIPRRGSAFQNRAGEAGAYDFSLRGNRAFQAWVEQWAVECLRVLKPGGHALVFGGTRTYHRLASGLEDAGFEIRDCLAWMFGSGFPKSLDVSKAIDKAQGVEGEFGGPKTAAHAGWIERGRMRGDEGHDGYQRPWMDDEEAVDRNAREYLPGSDEARRWQGWGTALKPGHEPIVLARKPLAGTVAATVLEHGTGALNIDACRIVGAKGDGNWSGRDLSASSPFIARQAEDYGERGKMELGRWPANVVLDEEAATMLDEQTGERPGAVSNGRLGRPQATVYGDRGAQPQEPSYGDTGGASRFFYCAKVSRAERNAGLDGFEERDVSFMNTHGGDAEKGETWHPVDDRTGEARDRFSSRTRNRHPTVKPIDLMRWLIRLVTPPGGTVLDPFLGSGSTGCAAVLEGIGFVGCEREPDYMAIAEARIGFWREHGEDGLRIVHERDQAAAARKAIEGAGQLDIFEALAAAEGRRP